MAWHDEDDEGRIDLPRWCVWALIIFSLAVSSGGLWFTLKG